MRRENVKRKKQQQKRKKKKSNNKAKDKVNRRRTPAGRPDAEIVTGIDDFVSRLTDETRMLSDMERPIMISGEAQEHANEVFLSRPLRAVCEFITRTREACGAVVLFQDEAMTLRDSPVGHHVIMAGIDLQKVIEDMPGVSKEGLAKAVNSRGFFEKYGRLVVVVVAAPEALVGALGGAVPDSVLAGMVRLSNGEVPVLVGLGARARLVHVTLKAS